MAYTKIKAIKSTLKKAIDYILDENKVGESPLVYGHDVTPEFADLQFERTVENAKKLGKRTVTVEKETLAHHLIQNFNPKDKITPELAHEIGKKLAEEFTKGEFQFVVATHIDTGKIHNHIIINSYSNQHLKKLKVSPYKTIRQIKSISNRLCVENGLTPSQITQGSDKEKTQNHQVTKPTLRDQLKEMLDGILSKSKTIDEFKMNLTEQKIEFKEGKQWSFKLPHAKRFMRGDTLGEDYTPQRLKERLGEPLNAVHTPTTQKVIIHDKPRLSNLFKRQTHYVQSTRSNQTINFEKRLYYQARKQQIQDVKALANQLLFIRQENIKTMSDFDKKIREVWKTGNEVKENIKQLENKYKQLSSVYKELVTYQENKTTYEKYQSIKLGFIKDKYYDKNIGAINLAEGALNVLSRYKVDPNTELEKVTVALQEVNHQLQPLKKEYRVINERVDKIKEVKEYAKMINQPKAKDIQNQSRTKTKSYER